MKELYRYKDRALLYDTETKEVKELDKETARKVLDSRAGVRDSSFDEVIKYSEDLRKLDINSDEQTIRSLLMKGESIAKQAEGSIEGLSREYNLKLQKAREEYSNENIEKQFYKARRATSNVQNALEIILFFFGAGGIQRVLTKYSNGRQVGERFPGKTDKYLAVAKRLELRFAEISRKFNSIIKDSIIEDADKVMSTYKAKIILNVKNGDGYFYEGGLNRFPYKDFEFKGLLADSIRIVFKSSDSKSKTFQNVKDFAYQNERSFLNTSKARIKKVEVEQITTGDSLTEDALSKFVQSYLSTKKVSSKAEQDEIIKFLLERNKITTEDIPKVRSLLKIVKDALTEDSIPKKAKVGDKIRIIKMLGEPDYTGRVGIVESIDVLRGQLHGTWGELAIQEADDQYMIIERK